MKTVPLVRVRVWAVIAGLAAAAACVNSTKLIAVWNDPAAASTRFKKIIVAFQSQDEVLRRNAEQAVIKRVPRAIAAYTMLANTVVRDQDQAKAAVRKAGFDGAVVMRLVRTDKETVYSPGSTWWGTAPYTSMWGYWGYGWGTAYQPGYITNDTIVTLETNVYSVQDEKLLWASRSETMNPPTVSELIDSVVSASIQEMKRRKIL